MATNIEFVNYIKEQLSELDVKDKKMFGEYGLYYNSKFYACICDNQLFVKITSKGEELIPNCKKAPPYKGASLYFLISDIDNKELLKKLTVATCDDLPLPKPKKKKQSVLSCNKKNMCN